MPRQRGPSDGRRTKEQKNRRTKEQKNRWTEEQNNGWAEEQNSGWIEEQNSEEQNSGWTEEQNSEYRRTHLQKERVEFLAHAFGGIPRDTDQEDWERWNAAQTGSWTYGAGSINQGGFPVGTPPDPLSFTTNKIRSILPNFHHMNQGL